MGQDHMLENNYPFWPAHYAQNRIGKISTWETYRVQIFLMPYLRKKYVLESRFFQKQIMKHEKLDMELDRALKEPERLKTLAMNNKKKREAELKSKVSQLEEKDA